MWKSFYIRWKAPTSNDFERLFHYSWWYETVECTFFKLEIVLCRFIFLKFSRFINWSSSQNSLNALKVKSPWNWLKLKFHFIVGRAKLKILFQSISRYNHHHDECENDIRTERMSKLIFQRIWFLVDLRRNMARRSSSLSFLMKWQEQSSFYSNLKFKSLLKQRSELIKC